MKQLTTLLFLLITLSVASYAQSPGRWTSPGQKYSMADLEALEGQKSYREFFEHALDILPSLRGDVWQQMVADMAVGLIDFKTQRQDYKKQSWDKIEELSLWPVLQSDEFFQTKRRRYFLSFIKKCLESQENSQSECVKDIRRYWANSFKNIDLGLQIAELIEKHSLELNPWDYLSKAPKSELSHFYCERPILQSHLVGQLGDKVKDASVAIDKWPEHIDELMNKDCWEKLTPNLKQALMARSTPQLTKDLIYQLLKSKKVIEQEQEDLFLTVYLLEGPIVGDTFNLAWTRLSKISEDYERREVLLKNIKQIDPLPGALFASPNAQKRDVIMRHIHQHFPEYFPHYAQTCLNYMSGQGEFPRGNPTIQCSDFFNVAEGKGWVQDQVKTRYSGLRK